MWFAEGRGGYLLVLLAASAPFLLGLPVRADVYRAVGEEGLEVFTDCPVTGEERLFLKDAPTSGAKPGPGRAKGSAALRTEGGGLPVNGIVTSSYGLRSDPIDGLLRLHRGVDIAVPEGTPVRPIERGRVAFSGYRNGYGNVVIVEHGGGQTTVYAHNSSNWAAAGETVEPYDIIALSGSTGRSTGPHVHFEVWRDGANETEAFLRGTAGSRASAGAGVTDDFIRRIIQADGTILFTNLSPSP